jgi:hypothetical protein
VASVRSLCRGPSLYLVKVLSVAVFRGLLVLLLLRRPFSLSLSLFPKVVSMTILSRRCHIREGIVLICVIVVVYSQLFRVHQLTTVLLIIFVTVVTVVIVIIKVPSL